MLMKNNQMRGVGALATLAVLLCVACDGESIPEGCDVAVWPGVNDQAELSMAIASATAGQTVCITPGTYTMSEQITITTNGLTLRGTGATPDETVLDFSAETEGFGVHATGTAVDALNDITIENFTILDSFGNGLQLELTDHARVRSMRVGWTSPEDSTNGEYGIYPISSLDAIVEDSEAWGASDAGLYIGNTTDCIIRNNYVHGNVAGYEMENVINCEVYGNEATGNTGGILVFELPVIPTRGTGTLVHDNNSSDNNVVNFARGADHIVSFLPTGTGMMVLAGNDVEVRNNTMENNQGTGVLVISMATACAVGVPCDPTIDPGYDGWIEGVHIHDNTFTNNGYAPGGAPGDPLAVTAAALGISELEDIIWGGFMDMGVTPDEMLCIQNNGAATFRNADVPGNFTMSTTDASPHDCSFPARPATMLPAD